MMIKYSSGRRLWSVLLVVGSRWLLPQDCNWRRWGEIRIYNTAQKSRRIGPLNLTDLEKKKHHPYIRGDRKKSGPMFQLCPTIHQSIYEHSLSKRKIQENTSQVRPMPQIGPPHRWFSKGSEPLIPNLLDLTLLLGGIWKKSCSSGTDRPLPHPCLIRQNDATITYVGLNTSINGSIHQQM